MTLIKAAVTFKGLTKEPQRPNSTTIQQFIPDDETRDRAVELLKEMGFIITFKGELTVSIKGSKEKVEELFETSLTTRELPPFQREHASEERFLYPESNANWNDQHPIYDLIDDVYPQWPWYFLSRRFGRGFKYSPFVDYHHLRLPGDVAMTLNASSVHRRGITGKGIKVVMLDSGFDIDHHHFKENGYRVKRKLGPGANMLKKDYRGHGTAMAANLLAVAPDVKLVGIKLIKEGHSRHNTTLVEGFEKALKEKPNIISLSISSDLAFRRTPDVKEQIHLDRLPNNLKALEGLILLAISRNITVVCAAGNGQVGFPAMIPEVISVGGVFVNHIGKMEVSDYTSAFESVIYPERKVPDICGLSGKANTGEGDLRVDGGYVMSPVQKRADIDADDDGTVRDDSWAIIGGSSAATAQVAGVCALMLQKKRGLTPLRIREIITEKSRKVILGAANPKSNAGSAIKAVNGAAGHGLIDAQAAVNGV